jgi:hypothetical protein
MFLATEDDLHVKDEPASARAEAEATEKVTRIVQPKKKK